MNNREILEELVNGVANIEPALPGKNYRRLTIQVPETSQATIVEYDRALKEAIQKAIKGSS